MNQRPPTSEPIPAQVTLERRIGDVLAFAFTLVILVYAAAGPITDAVRGIIEATTAGFDELSRRE